MVFDVRLRDGVAEAIRRNAVWPPRIKEIATNGGRAIEAATGCKVAWMRGDPSVLFAGVDCGDGAPPKPRRNLICRGSVGAPVSSGESDVLFSCF